MKVLFTDIRPIPKAFLRRHQITRTTLRNLLARSDLVSLHVPLTPRTKGMMKTANLRLMKPSSILINTSRGEVVREKDLAACLRRRGIRAAALDVFEKEPLPLNSALRKLDNVILTPHCAPSFETTLRVRDLICENVRRAVAGRRPLHPLPEKY
jgi:phosphoglycerate dehydrogenase-like enzyme